jgi:hypothetical protein
VGRCPRLGQTYPPVRQSLFAPLSIDIEDEDRDEDDR